MERGTLILVICVTAVFVIGGVWWFLNYLKQEKKKAEDDLSAPTKDESLIRIVCIFGLLTICAILVYEVVCLVNMSSDNSDHPVIVSPTPTEVPIVSGIEPKASQAPSSTPKITQELTKEPTIEPTATSEPTQAPTVAPTAIVEPTATPEPTVGPTVTPNPTATLEPTATPRPTATPKPTATIKPTQTPTVTPTATPEPTQAPTVVPTAIVEPTNEPTATPKPTKGPDPTVTPDVTKAPKCDDYVLPEDAIFEGNLRINPNDYDRDHLPGQFSSETAMDEWFIDRQYRIFMEPIFIDKYGMTLVGEKKLVNTIKKSNWDIYWYEYYFTKGRLDIRVVMTVRGEQYIDALDGMEHYIVKSLEIIKDGEVAYTFDRAEAGWPSEGFDFFLKNLQF